MALELDHVFMCVEDAPAAERALSDFGLRFGLRAVHGGQGTANVYAFFIFLIPATLPIRTRRNAGHDPLKHAPEHHLELDWDGGGSGEYHDFRPALPLLLRW